ncbi:LysR family transcriptional regulator [Pseudomonas sp. R5(2019)]|uniref:LysR family transcriptional regulator n=1 Tax=Pseudomonas sp. R5(2019) TaxID=2697566 RepID=UPI00141262C2|nr:LysR family transcriptional regulator [Pseudomonas sp. R5(2019)]
MPTIDLNALMLFHEIATAGSLARASVRCGVPKATLSRQLRALEEQLELVLVKRNARGVMLTEAGKAILEHCERIRTEVASVTDLASETHSEPTGTLRISMPFGFGGAVVTRVIACFARQYPLVKLEIMATNNPVDLGESAYDVAIHVGRVGNPNLPSRLLAELERGLYASPEFIARSGKPNSIEDLANFDWVLLDTHLRDGAWPVEAGNANSPRVRALVSEIGVAFQLALEGVGISILPVAMCTAEVAAGRLQRLLPELSLPPTQAYASYVERRHQPARLNAFLEVLRAEFSNYSRAKSVPETEHRIPSLALPARPHTT